MNPTTETNKIHYYQNLPVVDFGQVAVNVFVFVLKNQQKPKEDQCKNQ